MFLFKAAIPKTTYQNNLVYNRNPPIGESKNPFFKEKSNYMLTPLARPAIGSAFMIEDFNKLLWIFFSSVMFIILDGLLFFFYKKLLK